MDGSEITSFNIAKKTLSTTLQSPDENHFAVTPENRSPSNVFRSDDCNELLAKELAKLDETALDDRSPDDRFHLVSQSSVEIDFSGEKVDDPSAQSSSETELQGEVSRLARCSQRFLTSFISCSSLEGVDHLGRALWNSAVRRRLQHAHL